MNPVSDRAYLRAIPGLTNWRLLAKPGRPDARVRYVANAGSAILLASPECNQAQFPIEQNSARMLRSVMPIEQIVALLLAERNRLDAAIQALQGPAKHRGRPPGRKASAPKFSASAPNARKRKLSAAARKAMANAAKKRWAAIKAGKAPNPFARK
jgi:hypothetical protein